MNLFTDLRGVVVEALDQMADAGELPRGLDYGNVTVEPPRDPAHGDMATNAAMVLAKPAGMKPRDIADKLAARLTDPRISAAEIAGPGFLNLRLSPTVWQGVVASALAKGADFGRSDMGAGTEGQRRIRQRQPHRPDACGPCPRRGLRRCAGAAAGFFRP